MRNNAKNDIHHKNYTLLDALMPLAATEAFNKEMSNLPSNEELNRIYKPSAELDKRIKRIIRQYRFTKTMKQVNKIAAGFILGLCLMAIPLLSVEASRNAIINAIVEYKNKHTKIQFSDETMPSVSDANSIFYYPTYLPEGFYETERLTLENTLYIRYRNKSGEEILIQQSAANTGSLLIDSENMDFVEVSVEKNKAFYLKAKSSGEKNTLMWEYERIVIKITSLFDSKEMIQIGESLKKFE